jgi:hypothetical protein
VLGRSRVSTHGLSELGCSRALPFVFGRRCGPPGGVHLGRAFPEGESGTVVAELLSSPYTPTGARRSPKRPSRRRPTGRGLIGQGPWAGAYRPTLGGCRGASGVSGDAPGAGRAPDPSGAGLFDPPDLIGWSPCTDVRRQHVERGRVHSAVHSCAGSSGLLLSSS